MEHSVFISYHHDSSVQLVERIVQALESSGIKCWYAPRDVQSKYAGDIVRAIEECKVFLLVMNRYSTHSEHVPVSYTHLIMLQKHKRPVRG